MRRIEFADWNLYISCLQNAFDRDKAQEEGIIMPEKGIIKEYDDAISNLEECTHELDLYLNVIRRQLHSSVNSLFFMKINFMQSSLMEIFNAFLSYRYY